MTTDQKPLVLSLGTLLIIVMVLLVALVLKNNRYMQPQWSEVTYQLTPTLTSDEEKELDTLDLGDIETEFRQVESDIEQL